MTSKNVTLYVNHQRINVPVNTTIIQACEILGIHIPKFYYQDLLLVADNCKTCFIEGRTCYVEVAKSSNPQPRRSMLVSDQIQIFTNTTGLHESIIQSLSHGFVSSHEKKTHFLLLIYPKYCPICDRRHYGLEPYLVLYFY
jgi:NADH-quinone oxidoreductase subunit G